MADAKPTAPNSTALSSTQRVVIAGGTGFLGLSLAKFIEARGYNVVLLSRRSPVSETTGVHQVWDGRTVGGWARHLDGAAAVVNLAGRTVDCIKSPDNCDEILRSRVEATRVLGKAVSEVGLPPPVWVQMSTAHRYGDPPEVVCDEHSSFGYGLAPMVGAAWEAEFENAILPSMRGVVLRTSFVLGRSGGALTKLARLARWGLGGAVGHGKQGMSWIHQDDMNRLLLRGIEENAMSGAYMATAPNPVSNAEFMRELRRAVGMPIGLPAPRLLVRVGARLMLRTDPELALYGRYCVSSRLEQEGFQFDFPDVQSALEDIFGRTRAAEKSS